MRTRANLTVFLITGLFFLGCEEASQSEMPFALSAPPASLGLNIRLPHTLSPDGGASGTSQRAQIAAVEKRTVNVGVRVYESTDPGFVERSFSIDMAPGVIQEVTLSGLKPGLNVPVAVRAQNSSGQVLNEFSFKVDLPPGGFASNDPDDGLDLPYDVGEEEDIFRIDFNDTESSLFSDVFTTCLQGTGPTVPTISGGFLLLGGDVLPVGSEYVGEVLGQNSGTNRTFFFIDSTTSPICFETSIKVDSDAKAFFGLVNSNSCPTVSIATDVASSSMSILEGVKLDSTDRVATAMMGPSIGFSPGQFIKIKICVEPGGGSATLRAFIGDNDQPFTSTSASLPQTFHVSFRGQGIPASAREADYYRVYYP